MHAMSGISAGNFHALAEKFDFSRYETLCDVGGATGQLSIILAAAPPAPALHQLRPAGRCGPIAERAIAAAGVERSGQPSPSGDFFADPLPEADVITMGMILHDWNLERKHAPDPRGLRRPARGRRVHRRREPDRRRPPRERLRPDDVAEHAHRVRRRLRLHRRRLRRWCREAGFREVEVLPLAGPASAGIACKYRPGRDAWSAVTEGHRRRCPTRIEE